MKYTLITPINGILKDLPARSIPEGKCADGLNVMFKDGRVGRRWGYSARGSNLPLNGAVTSINWLDLLGTTSRYLVVLTTRDSYYLDTTWKFITKRVNRGTVTASGAGNRTVTLTAGTKTGTVTSGSAVVTGITTARDLTCGMYVSAATDGLLSSPGPTIGGTTTAVANVEFTYRIAGTDYTKAATAAGTAPGNDVVPTGKYGCVAFDIASDGTLDAIEATANSTGYNTAALAIAGLPAVGANHIRAFYVTAMKSDGNFTFGTTALNAANTTVAYGVGDYGGDFPADTYIQSIDSDTQITVSANATTSGTGVTLSFLWNNSLWTGASVYQIKFETTDMNAAGTWYTISQFDSTTQCTLTADGYAASADTYVIRLCWSGDIDDRHSTAFPIREGGERLLVATNGIENIQFWDGDTDYPFDDLGGAPNKARYLGFFASAGAERMYLGWTYDAGTPQPQTVEFSGAGDPEDHTSGIWYDLLQTPDEISGFSLAFGKFMIWKTLSATMAWAADSDTDPLDYQENMLSVGTPAVETAKDCGSVILFLSNDKRVYYFNGVHADPLPKEIDTELAGINDSLKGRCFAFYMPEYGLYGIGGPVAQDYPDKFLVRNVDDSTWTIWQFANYMTAFGFYKKDSSLSIGDLAGSTIGDLAGSTFEDLMGNSDDNTYLFGDSAGYVYEFDPEYNDDNGAAINAYFITGANSLQHTRDGDPIVDTSKKVMQLQVGMTRQSAGTLNSFISMDFGETWSPASVIALAGTNTYIERIQNFNVTGKQSMVKIQNVLGSDFEIETMLVGWRPYGITVGR